MKDEHLIERKVSSREIYRGKVVHLVVDDILLPDGRPSKREVVRHVGAVGVLPLLDNGDVLLVRQYRYPFAEVLKEIPAGKRDPGETAEACGRRELLEETGAKAEQLIPLGSIYPTPAYTDEEIVLFLATGLTLTEAHLDEGEFVEVIRCPLKVLEQEVMEGKIRDAKTVTAILKVCQLKQQEK